MGDLYFQIFGIKIGHFRGLNGPLEGQGRARIENRDKKRPKTGPIWSILGLHVKNGLTIFFQTPRGPTRPRRCRILIGRPELGNSQLSLRRQPQVLGTR